MLLQIVNRCLSLEITALAIGFRFKSFSRSRGKSVYFGEVDLIFCEVEYVGEARIWPRVMYSVFLEAHN